MENNKYLDKILDHMVRGTNIDYDREEIHFPYFTFHIPSFPTLPFSYIFLFSSFSKYCRDTFGLTKEEIEYIWNEYKDIITDKINNGEQ